MVSNATSYNIEQLRTLFGTHGIPEFLVTDNGTPFTSTEFAEFARKNCMCHVRVSLYNPLSNGSADRAVKTFSEGIKKAENTGSIESRIAVSIPYNTTHNDRSIKSRNTVWSMH